LADYGCVILQPYDMEVGAGTFIRPPRSARSDPGPECRLCAALAPSQDGRYGKIRIGCSTTISSSDPQPSPPDLQNLYLKSLAEIA